MQPTDKSLAELTSTDWWRRYQTTAQQLAEDEPTVERRVLTTLEQAMEVCFN